MPNTGNLSILINNQDVDLGEDFSDNLEINYILEEPESWQTIQASQNLDMELPSTKGNDDVFNAYYNPDIQDLSPNQSFRELMDVTVNINGTIPIIKGKYILTDARFSDKPEGYVGNMYSGNGDWLIDMQNLTIWDCVSTNSHTFDVSTVQTSWNSISMGGFDSDEDHDFVYAPIRYRQPFTTASNITGLDGPDDYQCNIYQLRPSISIYWILVRGFRQFGYKINSQFLNTRNYFRRMVLPWTWGDFYDINNQIIDGYSFKSSGDIDDMTANEPPPPTGSPEEMWTGFSILTGSPHGTTWLSPPFGFAGTHYVFSDGGNLHFNINNVLPPEGKDNFAIYQMQEFAGTYPAGSMVMTMNFPPTLSPYIKPNITLTFVLNLLLHIRCGSSCSIDVFLEATHIPVSGPTVVTTNSILPFGAVGGGGIYGGTAGYPTTETVYNFSVPNVNQGDVIYFRLKAVQSGVDPGTIRIAQSGYLNTNPAILGVSQWQYDSTTGQFINLNGNSPDTIWQPIYSSLQMTGFLLQLGNAVNFQQYDAFRNYTFLGLLGGLTELFNLEIQTDPIDKIVTIEPMFGTTLPSSTVIDGYFSTSKILDWSSKRDMSTSSKLSLFRNIERQLDFSLKQDGSDGGQNIWSARYNGIYLNNVIKPKLNNTNIENGVIAGVPGASRYMLPNRFSKGNRQISNSFFSATMHYNHGKWANIYTGFFGNTIAPQLICIFPENINDSSASAVTQTFEPKIAFYKGLVNPVYYGGWNWVGDPASPNVFPTNIWNDLPFMFSVNYGFNSGNNGRLDPVLSYSDQNVGGAVVKGLMKNFFLKRLAIYRNGQLLNTQMRLILNDICNWEHKECIKIDNNTYALISINGYKPTTDNSCECVLWKVVMPQQIDEDNSYPSNTSVLTAPNILSQYDLRYAQLLLFYTDIPII